MALDLMQSGLLEGLRAHPGLPPGFSFSQGSLQDYTDCARRFLLRYLLRLAWPALESEPVLENERRMQQGERFHRMAQQYWLGVPSERLEAMIDDPELRAWWGPFVQFAHSLQGAPRLYPEAGLSAPLGEQRLVAKFDLIAVQADGRVTIFDWKTSRRKPPPGWLAGRMQTRVYPYLIVRAGGSFNHGQAIPAQKVEMVYWYPAQPGQPERFTYSQQQFQEDQAYLTGMAGEIARRAGLLAEAEGMQSDPFPMTEREERCAYCVYRSLCERGERAGALDEGEGDAEIDHVAESWLDFDQIAEIEF
jgi:hypothetical protein